MNPPPQGPILIVDDDFSLRQFLKISLNANGYPTVEAADGTTALELAHQCRPSAVLLDLGLPDISGLEVTRRLRTWTWTPIIVISVRDEDSITVEALDLGADDYLTKPFQLNVMLARLRVALRRREPKDEGGVLHCGAIALDQDRRLVTVAGARVALTPNEYAILAQLMLQKERLLTHRELLSKVWGEEFAQETQLLRVHISNLRKKLESFDTIPAYIQNDPGVGYRLAAAPDRG